MIMWDFGQKKVRLRKDIACPLFHFWKYKLSKISGERKKWIENYLLFVLQPSFCVFSNEIYTFLSLMNGLYEQHLLHHDFTKGQLHLDPRCL